MIFQDAVPAADTANHPWVLYATLIAAVLGIFLVATDKALTYFGKWGDKWRERLDRQRTAAAASDDADLVEMRRSLTNLSTMLDEERSLNAKHRMLIAELYRYILAAQMDPDNLRNRVPDPSALLGTDATSRAGGGGFGG